MLPGKKYSPEDLLRVAWKRRWLIAVPAVVIASTTAVVSLFLPNRYRAATSVMIVPQRVPENFVRSTVTTELPERLNMISQQILSRTRLERIIQEFNLYQRERQRLIMEDVIEQMRKDISLQVNANRNRDGASSFNVSFESNDARTAMRVTERLGSLFVQENLEDRALLADQTNQFIGRIAHRELGRDLQAGKAGDELFEVGAVRLDLFRLAQLQVVEVARRPAVCHVHQQNLGVGQRGELPHVIEDGAVGR